LNCSKANNAFGDLICSEAYSRVSWALLNGDMASNPADQQIYETDPVK